MNSSSTSPKLKTPVTIISGFLGAGKTTIISHLIDELQSKDIQVAYIKNEVGSDTIDRDLMKGKNIYTKELLNGCICCTLVGNFHQALSEIVETLHPDRIIIEGSGVSDPTAIALTINAHPDVTRDGVLSIIDVVNFQGIPELEKTAKSQSTFTDVIVFNKVELVDDARKQQVVGYVREFNPSAPIVEAPLGILSAELAFGFHPQDSLHKTDQVLALSHHHNHEHDSEHLHHDHIHSFSYTSRKSFDQQKLLDFLQSLPRSFFRIKGYFQIEDSQVQLLNGVNGTMNVTPPPPGFSLTGNTLVFIGYEIGDQENHVIEQLDQL